MPLPNVDALLDLLMTTPPSPRPLSIKVLICWGILEASVRGFLITRGHYDYFLQVVRVTGWAASAFHLLFVSVTLYLAIGLWRLREVARKVAIGYACYTLLDALLAVLIFSGELYGRSVAAPDTAHDMHIPLLIQATRAITFGWIVWSLFKHKAAFGKPTAS